MSNSPLPNVCSLFSNCLSDVHLGKNIILYDLILPAKLVICYESFIQSSLTHTRKTIDHKDFVTDVLLFDACLLLRNNLAENCVS